MEDDDEFGDLYTDVLQPLQMSSAPPQQPIQSTPQPPTRSIDLNDRIPSDDEEILYGAKNSGKLKCDQPGPNLNLNKTDGAVEKNEKYWGEEAAPPADSGGRVFGGSSGLVKVEEKGFEQDPNFLDGIKGEFSQSKEETLEENFGIEDAAGEEDDFLIPGLSSSGARVLERGVKEGDGGDDWDDSDSEDDLQIVLNDNTGGGIMGMDGGVGQDEEDDEDGDNLVIVTGNADPTLHHHPPMEDLQDWGEDPSQAAEGMGERKDLLGGDAAGRPEVGVAAAAQKIGYGSHGYHPFHSQFKYVRPGAAPMPGAGPVATGGVPGQIRPPANMVPFAGRGRADWRPPGIKNAAPMQKNFHPGYGAQGWGNNGAGRGFGSGLDFTLPSHKTIFEVDIDGFEEKPWRLQGIDVSDFFNFGMNEETWKEYCKQLEQHRLEATMQSKIRVYESGRPEQEYDPDLPPELAAAAGHDIPENRNMGKTDLQNDLAKASARGRMQLPTGKAIQVETGFGERLPSIDTRPPRVRDSDAIIEIVLQRSPDHESVPGNDEPEDDVPSQRESHEVEDDIVSEDDHFDRPPPQPYNNTRKREASGRPPSMVGTTDKRASSHYSETEMEDHQDSRIKKVNSPHIQITHSPPSSPPTSFDQTDAIKDETLVVDRKSTEREGANDTKTRRTMKKQKHSSVERDDSKAAKSSENSKARSDQNMRDSVEQEVMQGGGSRRAVDEDDRMVRRQERERHQTDPYSHRKWDPNTHHHPHVKSENFERKKVRESEGVIWQDEDPHVGRMRIEDMRKRNHDEEMASRHRNKVRESERIDKIEHRSRKASENGLKTRHNVSDKREEPLHVHRESTSRRKRERDDNLDHHKRDDEQQLQMQQQQQQQQQQSFRYKEDGRLKRERDEWKERDGHRGVGIGHSRVKEDYRSMEKDYQFKEQSRRDRVENESVSRHRGREDVYAHGNKVSSNNEERISRHERGYSGKDVQDKKQKESLRKGKESDGGIHNSVAGSRRNREDHSSQRSERASSKSMVEQTRKSSKKHKENPSSEDEQQESRKGRSKLERWTSHKERDFGVALKEPDNGAHTKLPDPEPSKPQETINNPKPEDKDKEKEKEKESNAKTDDPNDNKHLDTVEKLKKRSERFKLPMPSEKEALAIKKMENEPLPSAQQPEARPEPEVKPERPARKRRWTSG